MHRRCEGIDYKSRMMYMVTLVTENRRTLFGEVVGRSDAPYGSAEAPHINLSPLGERVRNNFLSISERYEEIRVVALQMMPDHLHGILFVTSQMEKHLGQVISGFKSGCNKDYRELVLGMPPAQPGGPPSIPPAIPPAIPPGVPSGVALPRPTRRPPREAYDRQHGLLFASGYNDKLLLREGQLERWRQYLADNPRRLLVKREHREFLTPRFGIAVGDYSFSAIGNLALLRAPSRLQVRISRRSTPAQVEADVARFLSSAQKGSVLVSPAISPGEKAVMRKAFDAALPLIVLQENGYTPFSKPCGEQFDACAEGRLLLLSPWEHHNDRRKLSASQCQALNLMAFTIAHEAY